VRKKIKKEIKNNNFRKSLLLRLKDYSTQKCKKYPLPPQTPPPPPRIQCFKNT
jgi:hypothetical protein